MPLLYHPLVVHFPVALWLTSALSDVFYVRTGDRFYFRASLSLIGLGLLGAAVSIATGFIDLAPLVREGIGQAFLDRHRGHSLVAYASTAVYVVSFLVRWRRPATGRGAVLVLMLVGAVLIAYTGWSGGELRMVM